MDLTLFDCPTYKARITAKGCADMRKRPLLTERGASPAEGEVQLHRHPSCNDDCPILLAQRVQSKTAWQLIMERTGCDTQAKVAKKIGTYQSKVSQFLVRLAKGITPTGREWGRLLEITGLMPEELLLAARANTTVETSASSLPAAPSSPPQPSGLDLPPSTGPDGLAEPAEGMTGQAPMILHGDKVPPTMMGADPADALINTEQAQELLDSAESPPAPGGIGPAQPKGWLFDALKGQQPDDAWDFYDPRAPKPLAPAVWVTKDHHLCVNADAVREFNLADCAFVRLGRHKSSRAVCLVPTNDAAGALAMQASKDRGCRYVSGKGFFDRHGLDPVRNQPFPITQGPGGMLIITIETQAAEQLQEAS